MDDARLRTIWNQRQSTQRASQLGEPLTVLMKHTLAKKARQLGKLTDIWDEVIPEEIVSHTALEGFSRGVLTVMVDSAAHRYRLRTLLSDGLMKAIQDRFNGALNKVRMIPGQFYSVDSAGEPRYEF